MLGSLFPGVLAASIDVIGIPKRVLTSPDLAAYVMAEGEDGEEGGRAEARTLREYVSRYFRCACCFLCWLPPSTFRREEKTKTGKAKTSKN